MVSADDSPETAPATDISARRRRHDSYQEAWRIWFASLPIEEQVRLRKLKMHAPLAEQFGPIRRDEEDDHAEEVAEGDLLFVEGTAEDVRELEGMLSQALLWCVQAPNVVEMGLRWLCVLQIWRPCLLAGLTIELEAELQQEAKRKIGDGGDDGHHAGAWLEWGARGATLSQIGQRVLAMAYVLKPGAIGDLTLEAIGKVKNKTRQAVDKLVQDFRDTFGGVKSPAMRDDRNRLTCKIAQLERSTT